MNNITLSKPASDLLLKPIDEWLSDPDVSEIMLNGLGVVFVERFNRFFRYQVPEFDKKSLSRLFRLIANENQQTLSEAQPVLSGQIRDKMRVQLVIPPASKDYCFSIRKKESDHYSLDKLESDGFISETHPFYLMDQDAVYIDRSDEVLYSLYQQKHWPLFIKHAMQARKNIVISGATSSGKTTFLNACLNELPSSERLIILEDTLEVQVSHDNVVHLLAHQYQQGASKMTMQDLVQCSLRLRPDRIVLGEIRGREILDFIAASLTGHRGVMTTIHADNPALAFLRMCQMYKLNGHSMMTDQDIYKELKQAIDIVFQLNRIQKKRRLVSVYFKYASEKEGTPII